MNVLLDTHLLIWSATSDKRLSPEAASVINDQNNTLWFSMASLWEAAIKASLKRPDFTVDVAILRAGLLANGYHELNIDWSHILVFKDLPLLHKDPFDRLLVAQAIAEGMILLTVDLVLNQYSDRILVVAKGR